MHGFPFLVLLVCADTATAEKVETALASPDSAEFNLVWVRRLNEALDRLHQPGIDAILLDLTLPDSQGLMTLERLMAGSSGTPILIVSETNDEDLAGQAVERGAQDYLLPGHLDSYSLPRAVRNAIERKFLEDVVYAEKERAQVTLNSIGDAVLCTDQSGRITYINAVAEHLTGWKLKEAQGQPLATVFQIVDGVSRKPAPDPMEMAVEQNIAVSLTANSVLIRRDGFEYGIEDSAAPIHDRAGHTTGAVIVFRDVTASRALSMQMRYAAQHDALTRLPNRLLVEDRISTAIDLARRNRKSVAVMFLDLDQFKHVNDSMGHPVGDSLLQSVAKRLVASLRRSDTVSRQGGDEFVILLPDIAAPEDAAKSASKILSSIGAPHRVGPENLTRNGVTDGEARPKEASESARRLLDTFRHPHLVAGQELHVTASIGIAIYPGDGDDAETLLQNADTAMYKAKGRGRNIFQFYTAEMNSGAIERHSVEVNLRRALTQNELLLHYQPKVSLSTGKITGVEALIRWQQPGKPLATPDQFVAIAEDCGLIVPIGRWVVREACMQERAWQKAGLPPLPVAVNVSAVEFRDRGFVDGIRAILAETGLDARYLELELTEGVLMKNVESTLSTLRELMKMGIHLAMDDFGTGYSSLSYLRQFPIGTLKVDRSFVGEITSETSDSALLSAIINMGRSLNCLVIAEGVETPEQKSYLQAQGCPQGQGFLFSRPLGAQQFAELQRAGAALPLDS